MTIAEILYRTDPKTLFELIVRYQLEGLAKIYLKETLTDQQSPAIEDEDEEQEYARLMLPSGYTGRVERRRGALTQPHRFVVR